MEGVQKAEKVACIAAWMELAAETSKDRRVWEDVQSSDAYFPVQQPFDTSARRGGKQYT